MTTRRRLLLTGARGFVGSHVLAARGDGEAFAAWDCQALPPGLDVRDATALRAEVERCRPDAVLHLAAQSFVPRSFEAPEETLAINLMGTLNLLQALSSTGFDGRLLFVSSGDVYGRVDDAELPVDESTPVRPRNPYATSKVAAEELCRQWHRSNGLDAIIARPFNHIGPGQDARFVVSSLAHQVADVAAGRRDVIEAGDIDVTRDFTDVRDVVAAYAMLLADGTPGATYVVASGVERSVRSLLDAMCAIAGVAPRIVVDSARLRPSEQRRMVADPAAIRRDTGWAPCIPLQTTLTEILEGARHPA